MPGCKQSSPKNLSVRGLSALAITSTFFVLSAQAHYPTMAQLARFQSGLLHGSAPFTSKGSASIGKVKVGTALTWVGPSKYQLVLTGVPSSFFVSSESSSPTWSLTRDGKTCVIKTDMLTVNCPAPNFWAVIELSGQPDLAAKALTAGGFLNETDGIYKETNSKDLVTTPGALSATSSDIKNKRLRLNVGSNGSVPVAVVEIRGEKFQTGSDTAGDDNPLIQYDQTFLAPLLARWKLDGDVLTLKAVSDIETGRKHPRYTYVLSSRLDVLSNSQVIASFSRQEPVPAPSKAWVGAPRAISDVTALKNVLSPEGKQFLQALLLTH